MLDVVRLLCCICIWVSNLIYCTGGGGFALPPQLAPWLPACSWDLFPGPTNLPACNALNFHAHRPGGEMIGASSAFCDYGWVDWDHYVHRAKGVFRHSLGLINFTPGLSHVGVSTMSSSFYEGSLLINCKGSIIHVFFALLWIREVWNYMLEHNILNNN